MRAARFAAALACCLLLSTGCSQGPTFGAPPGLPGCPSPDGQAGDPLILIAQSVPSAQWLPCLGSLPVGWSFRHLDARSGGTRVLLGAEDGDGQHKVTVALDAGCDVTGAREVSSERPGIRRYDRVVQAGPGYRADSYHLFPGGCVTHQFDLRGRAGAEAAAAVSAGLDFLSRAAVAAVVNERSRGRLTLDPAEESQR